MTLSGLLDFLQSQTASGVLCYTTSDSDEKTYLWWGDRTMCLGHTVRLASSINAELEEDSEVVREVVSTPTPSIPPNLGLYL